MPRNKQCLKYHCNPLRDNLVLEAMRIKKKQATLAQTLLHLEAEYCSTFINNVVEIIGALGSLRKIVQAVAKLLFLSSHRRTSRKELEAQIRDYIPSRKDLDRAEAAVFMVATAHTNPDNFKRLKPELVDGVLVSRGARLGQNPLLDLTGKTQLPLLDYNNPLE